MSQRPQTSSCVALAQSPGPFRARGLAYLESSGKPREWFKACGWRQLKQATSFACLACRAYPMKRPSSTSSSVLPMMVLAHNPLPVLILPLLPPPSLLQTFFGGNKRWILAVPKGSFLPRQHQGLSEDRWTPQCSAAGGRVLSPFHRPRDRGTWRDCFLPKPGFLGAAPELRAPESGLHLPRPNWLAAPGHPNKKEKKIR